MLQLPKTRSGKQYAVVFVDYLTKWPEVFATYNQSAYTIAKLLVEKIISQHGVPAQLLSDHGRAFLSKLALLQKIGTLRGFYKVNTSAYHPQTDGIVEKRFNRTLIDMLAKTTELNGKNWDEKLPFVLLCFLHISIDLLCKSLLVSHLFDCFMAEIQSYLLKMLYPVQWRFI